MPFDATGFQQTEIPTTVAGVLRRAAALIGERGHERIGFRNDEGGICTATALFLAVDTDILTFPDPNPELVTGAFNALGGVGAAIHFNARHSAAEVIAALNAAADSLS